MRPILSRASRQAPSHPLSIYLSEINRTPLLSADEEKSLARRVEIGDAEARDHLVRANLRLVVNIARQYANKGLALQDLIEEGNLGLLRAVEGFDPRMNTRFSTYASFWIRQSMKRALINSAKTIRIPAYMVDLLAKWRRLTLLLQSQLGRAPATSEIARRLDLPFKKLRSVKRAIEVHSTTAPSEHDEDGWQLSDLVTDTRRKQPHEELLANDALQKAYALLDAMDPREADVVRMRFGLGQHEPRTLKEIGRSLGLSRERVRQIESKVLGRLTASIA